MAIYAPFVADAASGLQGAVSLGKSIIPGPGPAVRPGATGGGEQGLAQDLALAAVIKPRQASKVRETFFPQIQELRPCYQPVAVSAGGDRGAARNYELHPGL